MNNIFSYAHAMDFVNFVLEYYFDDESVDLLSGNIQFETVDSNFAPEPSVACGVRADCGMEFVLIYLQKSKRLWVFPELKADRLSSTSVFMSEQPALSKQLLRIIQNIIS